MLQCYRQYTFPSEGGWGSATDAPWNRNRHIFNICKYLSAIFVVVFDALQGSVRSGDHFDISELLKPSFFQGMWILSVVVKTASNIYWDHTQVGAPALAPPRAALSCHVCRSGDGSRRPGLRFKSGSTG